MTTKIQAAAPERTTFRVRHCRKCGWHKFADAGREITQADGKTRWVCNACLALRKPGR